MKKGVVLFAIALFLHGLVANAAFAKPDLNDPNTLEALLGPTDAPNPSVVTVIRSVCIWGLYLDNSSAIPREWESRLFISNIDTEPRNFDVTIFANNRRVVTLVPLVPADAVRSFTCAELGACNNFGWLLVISDAPFMAATLFVINNLFGQGSFTAQTGFCFS